MSWTNVFMYNAVQPSYDSDKNEENKGASAKEEIINADDPANKDAVRKILFEQ